MKNKCKDCKWFDPGIPTRPKGFCHYGICARDGEDVGENTPACYFFEGYGDKKGDEVSDGKRVSQIDPSAE